MADPIWFWQRIVSPHMAGLVAALAEQRPDVRYVAEMPMSADRAALGWTAPALGKARLCFARNPGAVSTLVAEAPKDSIHVCQGLRGNGLVGFARDAVAQRGLRQWVVIETVEERGRLMSWAKRAEYRRLLHQWQGDIEGILAMGHAMPAWLVGRGMHAEKLFPFAYFLPEPDQVGVEVSPIMPFQLLFVGQFIERKRLDLLIDAVVMLKQTDVQLTVIGSGPLEAELRARAEKALPCRLHWLGRISQDEIPLHMATADCLVLPSRHDGWGAVVSEALMAGTPVICSDRCGAAGVVRASGTGGVFPSGDRGMLAAALNDAVRAGRQRAEQRAALSAWARCLHAEAGADYLSAILRFVGGEGARPIPPWERSIAAAA